MKTYQVLGGRAKQDARSWPFRQVKDRERIGDERVEDVSVLRLVRVLRGLVCISSLVYIYRGDYRALTCTYPPNQEPDNGLRGRVRALETVAVQLQLFLVKLVEEGLRLSL